MTEYWQSQARKYCEFCKCWFADNKVSISFHENGKRHKENVQKHISTLSKKSAKELKQKEKMDDDIKKMEAAAMAAYLKDVQNNADLTSQSINDMVGQSMKDNSSTTIVVSNQPTKKAIPVWHEVKSDNDTTYYWNTVTNANYEVYEAWRGVNGIFACSSRFIGFSLKSEVTWDPPDEYLSLADQEQKKLKDEQQEKKKEKLKKQKQKEAQKEVFKEVNAHLAREKMRELAVNKDEPPLTKPAMEFGPAPRASKPYGSWTPVVNEPVKEIDLQLPKLEKELQPPPVVVQPEIIQFKEKRVQSLGDEPVEFKRRKFNNARKNMRQKLDDD